MASQLDILSKVMVSLKEEQAVAVDNVQALLNNRDNETYIVSKIKKELENLSRIESVMAQNEFFMIQIAQSNIKTKPQDEDESNSTEDINSK